VAHGSALGTQTCPRGEVPELELIDEDVDLHIRLIGYQSNMKTDHEHREMLGVTGLATGWQGCYIKPLCSQY
jgi:hypothetical protein